MSKLNDYIGTLMHDDDALQAFLNDPIKAGEKEFGITKADRSVLRRVVHHMSNNSKNGYSIKRSLSSYRRSLRLLQNVLHSNTATYQNAAINQALSADDSGNKVIAIYYTGNTKEPGAPVDDPGLAYTNHVIGFGAGNTLGEMMRFPKVDNPSKGQVVQGAMPGYSITGESIRIGYEATYEEGLDGKLHPYITAFLFPMADGVENPGRYDIPLPTSTKTRDPFWFYSENGQAISKNQMHGVYRRTDAPTGSEAESFENYPVTDKTNYFVWQAIAPDQSYGFGTCD